MTRIVSKNEQKSFRWNMTSLHWSIYSEYQALTVIHVCKLNATYHPTQTTITSVTSFVHILSDANNFT